MNKIHLDRFDLNLLVVLRAVLAAGSVTGAAQRLSITQSAVSHALRRLRNQTGDALFERRGIALVPTEFTKNLAAPLQRALRGLEDTLNAAGGFDPGRSERRFVVGMDDRIELFTLPGLVENLCAAHAVNAVAGNMVLQPPFRLPVLRYFLYWNASADADAGIGWLRDMLTRSLNVHAISAQVAGGGRQATQGRGLK